MLRLAILSLLLASSGAQARDIAPTHPAGETTFTFSPGLVLHMRVSSFDPATHSVTRCKVLDWEGVCLIDGKPIFGTDWGTPRSVLESAELEVEGLKIPLDVSSLYEPWIHSKNWFSVAPVEGGWEIRGCFSDGAGSYVVQWLVIAGVSIRTLISKDEVIMARFPCNSSTGGALPNYRSSGRAGSNVPIRLFVAAPRSPRR